MENYASIDTPMSPSISLIRMKMIRELILNFIKIFYFTTSIPNIIFVGVLDFNLILKNHIYLLLKKFLDT